MSTPLPRSLFGRLVLILIGGVVLAQFAGFGFGALERAHVLRRSHGQLWAQRVADIVSLLNAMGTAERRHMARVLSHPRLRVTLGPTPLRPSVAAPTTNRVRAFRHQLDARLGGDAFRFDRLQGPLGPPQFLTQVRLHDGIWVRFRFSPGPDHPPGWPLRLLLGLSVFVAVMLVIVLLAVRWVTRPLDVLARAADALGEDMDRPPLSEAGPTEVVRASRAFNRMQRRLKENLADRVRLLAAVSHDLKTPITRLRLRAELLDDEPLRDKFIRDLNEMEALTEATLDYMRGSKTSEPAGRVELSSLLAEVQRDWAEQGCRVEVDVKGPIVYQGHRLALRRCIDNLVGNALKYARQVRVSVEDSPGKVIIRILDRGPGIPVADLERVFEPFYRLEHSRNRTLGGTGLGLGIARNVARLHGGELSLHNRPEGGLEARLELPRPT